METSKKHRLKPQYLLSSIIEKQPRFSMDQELTTLKKLTRDLRERGNLIDDYAERLLVIEEKLNSGREQLVQSTDKELARIYGEERDLNQRLQFIKETYQRIVSEKKQIGREIDSITCRIKRMTLQSEITDSLLDALKSDKYSRTIPEPETIQREINQLLSKLTNIEEEIDKATANDKAYDKKVHLLKSDRETYSSQIKTFSNCQQLAQKLANLEKELESTEIELISLRNTTNQSSQQYQMLSESVSTIRSRITEGISRSPMHIRTRIRENEINCELSQIQRELRSTLSEIQATKSGIEELNQETRKLTIVLESDIRINTNTPSTKRGEQQLLSDGDEIEIEIARLNSVISKQLMHNEILIAEKDKILSDLDRIPKIEPQIPKHFVTLYRETKELEAQVKEREAIKSTIVNKFKRRIRIPSNSERLCERINLFRIHIKSLERLKTALEHPSYELTEWSHLLDSFCCEADNVHVLYQMIGD